VRGLAGRCAAVLLICVAPPQVQAQTTLQAIDPLVRPTEGAGGYTLSAALDYTPSAVVGQTGLQTGHQLGVAFGASYNLSSALSVFGRGRADAGVYQQLTADGASGRRSFGLQSTSLGAQYRFAGAYSPAVSVEVTPPLFGQPWSFQLGATASLVRDPLVVDAALASSFTTALGTATAFQSVAATFGVGFVVNDSFTLRGQVTQSWTIDRVVIPTTMWQSSLSYAVDPQRTVQATLETSQAGGLSRNTFRVAYVLRR
jgi:hypothetical protein